MYVMYEKCEVCELGLTIVYKDDRIACKLKKYRNKYCKIEEIWKTNVCALYDLCVKGM
jgi:hypothetical protein